MAKSSTANRYRPTKISDLVGQETLQSVLSNAINNDDFAAAYLFTGIRGTGKTTTARIIAKAINCDNGPIADPCGECSQCKAIAEERHLDVIEIDAAANTGVENIREIIEQAQYRPVQGRYKVYIIDEVHMLSTNAFNALLKTLEEPPEHVVFILATTELKKVPTTILSRCQKFDLKRIMPDKLVPHLEKISKLENVNADLSALELISRAADGSVRDALSLFDQAVSLSSGHITETHAREMLGLADRNTSANIINLLFSNKPKEGLEAWRNALSNGARPEALLNDIMEVVHLSSILAMLPDWTESSFSKNQLDDARDIAKLVDLKFLQQVFGLLKKTAIEISGAPLPGISIEMTLLRIASVRKTK